MTTQTPRQALADAWEAQALKCGEAAALPGLALAAALEQSTFAAQLRECARELRDLVAQEPQPAPGPDARRALLDIIAEVDQLDEPGPAADWIRMLAEYGLGRAPHPGGTE